MGTTPTRLPFLVKRRGGGLILLGGVPWEARRLTAKQGVCEAGGGTNASNSMAAGEPHASGVGGGVDGPAGTDDERAGGAREAKARRLATHPNPKIGPPGEEVF